MQGRASARARLSATAKKAPHVETESPVAEGMSALILVAAPETNSNLIAG